MSSSGHLSKELLDLVKSIGESRSKQEEDKIITAEAQILKQKFLERNLGEKKMRELLIRAIYVEMLGHDASFSHIHAVNLTQSKNLLVKKIGYLACSLFIDENSELLILMICTIQRDLQSKNHLEVLSALTVLGKLCNQHILMAVNEAVQKLLSHAHEMIRKKAVMVMIKMHKSYPSIFDQMDLKMKKCLCDKDPSVMAATLNYFCDQVKQRPADFKDLVNSFVVILKQVVEHRLPRDYDYHRLPAPWIQIRILEILSYLGADDKHTSEQMYEIINQVLKRADDSGINIGYALVYQCLKTITNIYPSQSLIDSATTTISRFLSSESHNLKYIGITGLAYIVKIDPVYTLNYQSLVVDCLEDADDTLKIKTLDLLFKMTNKQNIEAIAEKLLSYLKEAPIESSVRKDLVIKINSLCEDYAPSKNWYVRTMNKLYEMGGDLITSDLSNKFISSISEYEKESEGEKFRDSTITIYLKILKKNTIIPDSMLQVIAWIMGEYGSTLPNQKKITKILNYLSDAAYRPLEDELTRGYILTAITKLQMIMNFEENPKVEMVMEDYIQSKHVDVQQRAIEYKQLRENHQRISSTIMTKIPLNENQILTQAFDFELSFLNDFVQTQLSSGKKEYDQRKRQAGDLNGLDLVLSQQNKGEKGLNYKPYETPGMSRINTELPQSNPLFQQQPQVNPNDSIQLQNVQKKVWGQPQPTPTPIATTGGANNTPHYESANNLKLATNQMESLGTNPELQPKPKVSEKQQHKADEKIKKASGLFAGIGDANGKKRDDSEDSSDEDKKKRRKDKKKKKQEDQEETKAGSDVSAIMGGNLLEFDMPASTTSINDGLGSLLDPTPTISNTPQQPVANLLEDLFSTGVSSNVPPSIANHRFSSLPINTQQFGELWVQNPVEKKIVLQMPQISSPQVYSNQIRKLDFNVVEIIGNEVISAGQSQINGSVNLIHCRVNIGGHLELTIKGSDVNTVDSLVNTLIPQVLASSLF
eukprot:403365145